MPVVVSLVPYKFLPARIGGQKGIASFNKYLSFYVTLICITVMDNSNELATGYKTIRLFSSSRFRYVNILYLFHINKILKNTNATHLITEHPYFGWLALLLKRISGIKLVVHSHNIESVRFQTLGKWWWPLLSNYERWIHKNADYNFFIHEKDMAFAIKKFKLDPSKCTVITYGIDKNAIPAPEEKEQASKIVRQSNNLNGNEKILFFNGSFNYPPNVAALRTIAGTICPILDSKGFNYKVIVCGPWLTAKDIHHTNLILKGYVDDIELYFKAADVFINPVIDGGGIKTKLVEALGSNTNAVSTSEGSNGIDPALCNGKLFLAPSGNWEAFCHQILNASGYIADNSTAFYEHFYWGNNAEKAAEIISKL